MNIEEEEDYAVEIINEARKLDSSIGSIVKEFQYHLVAKDLKQD